MEDSNVETNAKEVEVIEEKDNTGVHNDLGKLRKAVKDVLPKQKPEPRERWEDLESIYMECAKGVISIAESVNSYIASMRDIPGEMIMNETVLAIKGLAKDLDGFSKDLAFIHERHKDKKGLIRDDSAHALSINIALDYVNFNERFRAVTSEPLLVLTEQMMIVNEKIDKITDGASGEVTEDPTDEEKTNG